MVLGSELMSEVVLSPLEARVLGVLVEKQHTVPDTYPLSLNALVAGCNQKTARVPVMDASESDVLLALDELKAHKLVNIVSGNRVAKFQHSMAAVLGVPSQSVALLATLVLRGPQTAAELRLNSERLHRFADVSSVEAFLDELSTKLPLRVVQLERAPGAREQRWAHLLCGEPVLPPATAGAAGSGGLAALQDELASLREELAALRADLQALKTELGVGGA
jgi:uncharacterized protein